VDKNATDKLNLAQLRAHLREKPRTKAGQVRQAWPDIKQLLDAGHSLKDVCQWLNEIGLQIGYARLSDYVSQLRRRETVMVAPAEVTVQLQSTLIGEAAPHPLAHILEREKKRVGFDYNSEPDPKKLI
jgi:hypothetical protein